MNESRNGRSRLKKACNASNGGFGRMIGETVNCENCGTEFEAKRRRHRFCTPACRYEFWTRTHPRLEIGKPCRIEVDEEGRLVIVQEATPE